MQKSTITLTSTKSTAYEKSNEMIGQLKDALVSASIISVASDNDPADGSGVARIIELYLLGSTRKYRFRALGSGATATIEVSVNSTGTTYAAGSNILSTNLTSYSLYLFSDSKTMALKNTVSAVMNIIAYKTVSGKTCVWLPYGAWVSDASVTYMYTPVVKEGLIDSDNVTSIFLLLPGLCSANGTNNSYRWYSTDDYKPDNNMWRGYDKYGCTQGQALEISSGEYLFSAFENVYIGYMA